MRSLYSIAILAALSQALSLDLLSEAEGRKGGNKGRGGGGGQGGGGNTVTKDDTSDDDAYWQDILDRYNTYAALFQVCCDEAKQAMETAGDNE